LTHFSSDGLFGSQEWSTERERRSYFYAAALLGLQLFAVGLSDLFGGLLERRLRQP
jgi:hypothetical protein